MSALYGRMRADDKPQVTRAPHHRLMMSAETWQGIIRVELMKGGLFEVTMSDKSGNHTRRIASGDLDKLELDSL